MNTSEALTNEHSSLQTICYKCRFVGLETASHICPMCGFPLIAEAGRVGTESPMVEEILARTSVNVGAPPLPGVDATPRKGQLLREARKKRHSSQLEAAIPRRRGTGTALAAGPSKVKMSFAFAGALAAGLVAAFLMSGTL